jgi:hypothetical protein
MSRLESPDAPLVNGPCHGNVFSKTAPGRWPTYLDENGEPITARTGYRRRGSVYQLQDPVWSKRLKQLTRKYLWQEKVVPCETP